MAKYEDMDKIRLNLLHTKNMHLGRARKLPIIMQAQQWMLAVYDKKKI